RGKWGSYPAGSLFLFPWLKPKGQLLTGKVWPAVVPGADTQLLNSAPIPNGALPVDDAFLRFKLQAPVDAFIGLQAGTSLPAWEGKWAWYTNVDKLCDGKPVGITWTSANLNQPWFGGSRWIPNTDVCNGKAWRTVIIAALNQASMRAC